MPPITPFFQKLQHATTIEKMSMIPLCGTVSSVALLALKVFDLCLSRLNITQAFAFTRVYRFDTLFISSIPLVGTIFLVRKIIQRAEAFEANEARRLEDKKEKFNRVRAQLKSLWDEARNEQIQVLPSSSPLAKKEVKICLASTLLGFVVLVSAIYIKTLMSNMPTNTYSINDHLSNHTLFSNNLLLNF